MRNYLSLINLFTYSLIIPKVQCIHRMLNLFMSEYQFLNKKYFNFNVTFNCFVLVPYCPVLIS